MRPLSEISIVNRFHPIVVFVVSAVAVIWICHEVNVNVQTLRAAREMGNVKLNQPALDFVALDLNGNAVSLTDYHDKKVVLLDFWATWCGPCRRAMVGLQTIEDKYKNHGFEIMSLNQMEPPERVRRFISDTKYDFHVVLDSDGSIAAKYGVHGIPTLVLVDKKGIIQWLQMGYSGDEIALQRAVERVVLQ